MRTRTVKYLSLTIGLLAALSIVFSHSFSAPSFKKAVSTQQETQSNDDEKNQDVNFTISATSFPSSTIHLEDTQPAVCLFEIIFSDETSSSFSDVPSLLITNFLDTILEVVISPNAP
jgi:hypothetical protein